MNAVLQRLQYLQKRAGKWNILRCLHKLLVGFLQVLMMLMGH